MVKKSIDALTLNSIEDLEEVKKNFLFFLAHTSDYIYFKDKHHRFTYTSNAFARLAGHENWQTLIGKNDFDIFPLKHAQVYFEKEKPVIQEGKELLGIEEPYYNLDGKLCYVSSSKRPIFDQEGNVTGLFGISRDITKLKELEAELSKRAHYDELTSLCNRYHFLEQAKSLLKLAKRKHQTLACYYIDLDGFKLINDQYGHDAGDIVLITIAQRFQNSLRDSDIIGRIGGDEFVVASLTNGQEEALSSLSTKLLALTNEPIPYRNKQLNLSCSIGIACYPEHGNVIEDLMIKADKAMYQAKKKGSHSVTYKMK